MTHPILGTNTSHTARRAVITLLESSSLKCFRPAVDQAFLLFVYVPARALGPGYRSVLPTVDLNLSLLTPEYHLYLLHSDGERLSTDRNCSDINGMCLGFHTYLIPTDAKSFTASNGQKDINAWMDVDTWVRLGWQMTVPFSRHAGRTAARIRIVKLAPDSVTGKYNYTGP
ncbi:hypothetical protein HK104_002523 [Borealophlyctis nickersoniae]|nr:hypothetical protein HK104_002523 [Borealophlyctis nickersoniae]